MSFQESKKYRNRFFIGIVLLCVLFLNCGEDATLPEGTGQATPIHANLSAYQLFPDMTQIGAELTPGPDGIPYDLNTPLFSDYSLKYRVIHFPEGKPAHYRKDRAFEFPVGTVISKTFSFPADFRKPNENVRRLETRLLVHQPKGWFAVAYVWNPEQTDATVAYGGKVERVSFIDKAGQNVEFNYAVPSKNQCGGCHQLYREVDLGGRTVRKQVILPIGPKARHINKTYEYPEGPANQIDYMADKGKLTKLPLLGGHAKNADYRDETASVDERARAYMDANCGHCHNPESAAGINSKLMLDIHATDLTDLGVCKTPGSAGKGGGGLRYDIVPGKPEESILFYRTATIDPGAMMPQLGRSLAHKAGVDLLHQWIKEMPVKDCP